MQLKEEINQLLAMPRRSTMEEVKSECLVELSDLDEQIVANGQRLKDTLSTLRAHNEELIEKERQRVQEALNVIALKLTQTQELIATTGAEKEIGPKLHREWVGMRKEMADSNTIVLGILNSARGNLLPPLSPQN